MNKIKLSKIHFSVFCILGLSLFFLIPTTKATDDFFEDFESYNYYQSLGIQNSSHWQGEDPGYTYATTTHAYLGSNSAYICDNSTKFMFDTTGTVTREYSLSFYPSSSFSDFLSFSFYDSSNYDILTFYIDNSPKRVLSGTTSFTYTSDTWNTLTFFINAEAENYKFKLNNGEWSPEFDTEHDVSLLSFLTFSSTASCENSPTIFWDQFTSSLSDEYSIDFTYPDATTTPDFSSWNLEYTVPAGEFNGSASVVWGIEGDEYEDYINIVDLVGGTAPINVPKGALLDVGEQYQATAMLFDENTDLIATSESINFTVTAGDYYQNNFYEAPTGETITCDPDSPFWEESMCHLFVFLFIPNQNIYNQFVGLADTIQTKAPFSYYYSAKNSLVDLDIDPNATYPEFSIDMPFAGSTTTVPIFIFQDSLVPEGTFSSFRTTLVIMLTFMFFMYLINRPLQLFVHKD